MSGDQLSGGQMSGVNCNPPDMGETGVKQKWTSTFGSKLKYLKLIARSQ